MNLGLVPAADSGTIGHLVELDGIHATIVGLANRSFTGWSVGHHVVIKREDARIVGLVCEMKSQADAQQTQNQDQDRPLITIKVELVGEVSDHMDHVRYRRGLRVYPELGATCHPITTRDLASIYAVQGVEGIEVGYLSNNPNITARFNADELLTRHFAVLGSTGVGKTTGVAMLMRLCLAERENLRVIILDPHNEYQGHFPDQAIVLNSENLEIPFWIFRFDEISDIIFAGRTPRMEEQDALFELIRAARMRFATQPTQPSTGNLRRMSAAEAVNLTADTPTPYRIADMVKVIDDWLGQLERPYPINDLRMLRNRIESIARDPRFRFMFGRTLVEDNMDAILSRTFRVPTQEKPVTIVELGGLPNEVVNAVVSVLARLAFDIAFWSEGGYEISFVCEEAHRYVPRDLSLGFVPTRMALGRIAKEGRKYGVSLGVVSQRPAEIDQTVLSQCSTIFAMRMPNEVDKAIVRNALSEYSASLVNLLPAIADREAIAFGEAIPTPMRMTFGESKYKVDTTARLQMVAPEGLAGLQRIIHRLRGDLPA